MNEILKQKSLPTGQILQILKGDITRENADAIVNAANEDLQHGGGVAGAISKQGGITIQRESNDWIRKHGKVANAHPAWTSAGMLPAKFVIHAVGPVWGTGEEEGKLSAAFTGSLQVADELGINSIAFPSISTGIFGFPKELAAKVFFKSVETYFSENASSGLNTIKLVVFDQTTANAFLQE